MTAQILPFRRPAPHDDPFRLWCSYWLDVYRMNYRAMWWWVN